MDLTSLGMLPTKKKTSRTLLVLGALFAALGIVVLGAAPSQAAYTGNITTSTSIPRAGSSLKVTGTGFAGHVKVKVCLQMLLKSNVEGLTGIVGGATVPRSSNCTNLGTFTSGASGTASGSVSIPSGTTPSEYEIVMTGQAPDGSVLKLQTPITVRKLAHTGIDEFMPVLLVGGIAATAGVVVFVVSRRRTAAK